MTRSARRALALALFCGLLCGLAGFDVGADGVSGLSVEFSPASFVPGDLVTAIVTLDPAAARLAGTSADTVSVESVEGGPGVLSVTMERRSGVPALVIRFVPWRAGPGYLPAMTAGGLELPRIRFDCGSALLGGDLRSPEPLPQLDPPGLYARLYLLGGALLVAVAASVAAASRAAPWFRALAARRAFARARREFDESLERISTITSRAAAWAELCSALRRFVGLRVSGDWIALTASEVEALPDDSAPGVVVGDIASVLRMGDSVRFAGGPGSPVGEGIRLAGSIADRLDEACAVVPRTARPGADKRESARKAS